MTDAASLDAHERATLIKQCFRQWDSDGNGFITKVDLERVLTKLLPAGETLTRADLDHLMAEADRNGNGRIEYNEFVEWLTRPGASFHAGPTGVQPFDLKTVMRPLFEVYDRNGDGTISPQEFAECHSILQAALRTHPVGQDPSDIHIEDPEHLERSAQRLYRSIDADGDEAITFEEFIRWQQTCLDDSGLLNEDVEQLVPALARQLKRVFKLADNNRTGELSDQDSAVLMHITKNVANFSRDIYNDEQVAHSSIKGKVHYTNRWTEPPAGLNISRLKGQHMKLLPVPTWGVQDIDLQVLCVPEIHVREIRNRRWLARVVRVVTFRTGREEVDTPCYYLYENLIWTRQSTGTEFEASLAQLPPELQLFCLLKAEANFGLQMPWEAIHTALHLGVEGKLITEGELQQYNDHILEMVQKAAEKECMLPASDKPDLRQQELLRLQNCLQISPRDVMTGLVELGVLRVSSIWADVVNA